MKGFRTAALILGLLIILIGVGTVGFHCVEGWGWFESFYTTLMTISTVGAGPENQIAGRGQIFNVILMFLGLAVVGFTIGSLTKAVVEFELGSFFGRRCMEKEISTLKDRFIMMDEVAKEAMLRKIRIEHVRALASAIASGGRNLDVIDHPQNLKELESLAGVRE